MAQGKEEGRVVAAYGAKCLVERDDGERAEAAVRKRAGKPVCGERVIVQETPETWTIPELLPRRNEFPRADRFGRRQVIAANLDRVVIVVAPKPEPTRDIINRYLVACESVGIPAAICLNKTDLMGDDADEWSGRERLYRGLGYPFIHSCAKQSGGLAELRELMREGTSILVGQSGVGKSSIVNRLLPDKGLETSDLSRATGKGRHTTSRTTLYHLPGGGELMDSPGVWEYGIWQMDAHEVAAGFREFAQYLGQCRFANCTHRVEPGCAIAMAAETGEIDPARLESYRRIVAALDSRS